VSCSQLKRPPTISTASASRMHLDRAPPALCGSSSGTVPRPIGDAMKGSPSDTRALSAAPAPLHAAPLPNMMTGRSALASSAAMRSMASAEGWGAAMSGRPGRSRTSFVMRRVVVSPAKSRSATAETADQRTADDPAER